MSRIYLKGMNWQSCFYPGKSSSTTDEQGCADGLTRPNLGKNGNASYIQAYGLCRKQPGSRSKFICKSPSHFFFSNFSFLLFPNHIGKRFLHAAEIPDAAH
jgi:hypothetical protein